MRARPSLSVVIPCHNSARFVVDTLRSVVEQSQWDLEVVVVDDGSTDQSADLCTRFLELGKFQHQVVRILNQGVSVARNIGLERVTGDYVLFVDSDDFLTRGYLDSCCAVLQQDDRCSFIGGTYLAVKSEAMLDTWDDTRPNFVPEALTGPALSAQVFLGQMSCSLSGCIFDTKKLQMHGIRFDAQTRYGEDQEFLHRALVLESTAYYFTAPILLYRQHVISAMSRASLRQWDTIVAHRRLLEMARSMGLQEVEEALLRVRIPLSVVLVTQILQRNIRNHRVLIRLVSNRIICRLLRQLDPTRVGRGIRYYAKILSICPRLIVRLGWIVGQMRVPI